MRDAGLKNRRKTSRKTVAIEAERNRRLELERALAGIPSEERSRRIDTIQTVVKRYLKHYPINHRPSSVASTEGRMEHVTRLLGAFVLPDLTEDRIRDYAAKRLEEDACGRTVNMELGELSRAIGKPWSVLWPKVRKLEERKDAGKALSPDEETRLLEATTSTTSHVIGPFVRIALLTGMRAGEMGARHFL